VLRGAIRAKSGKPVKILGSLAVSFLTVNFLLFMAKNQYTSTKYQLNFNDQSLFRILNLGHAQRRRSRGASACAARAPRVVICLPC